MTMSRTRNVLWLLEVFVAWGVVRGADAPPAVSCPDVAGAVSTYQNLTIPEGASLCFRYDPFDDATEKVRTGRIDVEETLSLPERVTVKATYAPIASTTGEEIRNVILRAPAGTRIDPARFVFAPDASKEGLPQNTTYPQRVRLEVETGADGRDALVAVVEPIVALVKSADKRAYVWLSQATVSSFEKADEWSDGRVPHAGAHYVKALGWGNTPVGKWNFPGLSLLYAGATVSFHATNQVASFAELAIGKSGGTFMTDNASDIRLVGGRLELFGDLGLSTWNGRNVRIDSEIVGAGDLLCKTPTHGTSYHMGSYEFTAFNTNFTGRIDVDSCLTAADFVPRYNGAGNGGGYKTFRLHDGRNLGGARARSPTTPSRSATFRVSS